MPQPETKVTITFDAIIKGDTKAVLKSLFQDPLILTRHVWDGDKEWVAEIQSDPEGTLSVSVDDGGADSLTEFEKVAREAGWSSDMNCTPWDYLRMKMNGNL